MGIRRMWYTLKCPVCGGVITSTHHYDFVWCPCKSLFVDGGRDYLRYGGVALNQWGNIKKWAGKKHGFVSLKYRRPDSEMSELFPSN